MNGVNAFIISFPLVTLYFENNPAEYLEYSRRHNFVHHDVVGVEVVSRLGNCTVAELFENHHRRKTGCPNKNRLLDAVGLVLRPHLERLTLYPGTFFEERLKVIGLPYIEHVDAMLDLTCKVVLDPSFDDVISMISVYS